MAKEKFDWAPVYSWVEEGGCELDGEIVEIDKLREVGPGTVKLLARVREAFEKATASPAQQKEEKRTREARTIHFVLLSEEGEVVSHDSEDNTARLKKEALMETYEGLQSVSGGNLLVFIEDASGVQVEGVSAEDFLALVSR